jgi:hypothetical protein
MEEGIEIWRRVWGRVWGRVWERVWGRSQGCLEETRRRGKKKPKWHTYAMYH